MGLLHAVRVLADQGKERFTIPLCQSVVDGVEDNPLLQNAVIECFGGQMFQGWLVDADPTLWKRRGQESADEIEKGVMGMYLIPLTFLVRSGCLPTATEDNLCPPRSPPAVLPRIGNSYITTRQLLENSATLASEAFFRPVATAVDLVSHAAKTHPFEYVNLAQHLVRFAPDEMLGIDFAEAFIGLADLSLMPESIPGCRLFGAAGMQWINLHPAWRFARIMSVVGDDPDLLRRYFHAYQDVLEAGSQAAAPLLDEICRRVGWPLLAESLRDVDLSPYKRISTFFKDLIPAFELGINRRKAQNISAPSIAAQRALVNAVRQFGSRTGENFEAFAAPAIEEALKEHTLLPPLMSIAGEFSSENRNAAGATFGWYYASRFCQQIVYERNLVFKDIMGTETEVRRYFNDFMGIPVDAIGTLEF